MKKKTNKKLALNKERVSKLLIGNMGDVKGGRTTRPCGTKDVTVRCIVTYREGCWTSLHTACFCVTRGVKRCEI